jgi:hypothetical protein
MRAPRKKGGQMKVNGTKLVFALLSIGVLTVTAANAQLVSIDGHLAVYDQTANISWLADANLAATNTFGVSGINPDGSMSYTTAQNWIAAMNAANSWVRTPGACRPPHLRTPPAVWALRRKPLVTIVLAA